MPVELCAVHTLVYCYRTACVVVEMNSEDSGDGINLTCIEENFGQTIVDCSNCTSLAETPVWMRVIHSIANIAQILASFIFCSLVLVLVIKYKKLQRRAVIVSLSLITADILLVFSYHLPAFSSTVAASWPFRFVGCEIFGFLSTTFILTRWYMMSVLCADRFFTVRYPFSYEKYSKAVLTILTLVAWIIPVLISMTCLNLMSSVAFHQNVPTCLFYAPTLDTGIIFFTVMTSLSFLVGCILPTGLYIWLYRKARKLRPSATKLGRMAVHIAAGTVIQVSLGPLDKDKNERRALFTFILIFITVFLTSAPIFFLQILRSISVEVWCQIPIAVHFLLVQLFLSSTMLDPILIMRDRDFRKCLKRMFSCHRGSDLDYDTAQFYASETYHSRRSDSIDIISYRGRRGSLCPSTGSASRMHGETYPDTAVQTANVEDSRRAHLSTLHELSSDATLSQSTHNVHALSPSQDIETQGNGEAIDHVSLDSGVINCTGTDRESIGSNTEEILTQSHWTITWCQPVSST